MGNYNLDIQFYDILSNIITANKFHSKIDLIYLIIS